MTYVEALWRQMMVKIQFVRAQAKNSQIPAERVSDIETLARETDMPVAVVHRIYEIEHAKLDQLAKVKTFIPVLVRRRVKEVLRSQRCPPKFDRLHPSVA